MFSQYKVLFQIPGTKGFSGAGFIARVPVAMIGIGIIAMLSQMQDSYWLAAGVSAAYTLSVAILAPQVSRLVDQYGQSRVVPYAAIVSIGSLAALLLCVHFNAPIWTFFLFALTSGCIPNMSAMVRARWTAIYQDKPQLHTAFSFESVLDELCFIIGPPISVGLSVAVFPEAGILLALIFLAVGVSSFVLQRKTEPQVYVSETAQKNAFALKLVSIRLLMVILIALGVIVGIIDVASVALAKQQQQPFMASIVLSLYAISSCFSGLVFGTLKIKMPLPKQFLISVSIMALATLPMLFTSTIAMLCLFAFISGFFFSPCMILSMQLVEKILPHSQLTEGLTWMTTGLTTGVALGAAITGWVIDYWGALAGFYLLIIGILIIIGSAFLGFPVLKRQFEERHA